MNKFIYYFVHLSFSLSRYYVDVKSSLIGTNGVRCVGLIKEHGGLGIKKVTYFNEALASRQMEMTLDENV